jgi:hypothetical protein
MLGREKVTSIHELLTNGLAVSDVCAMRGALHGAGVLIFVIFTMKGTRSPHKIQFGFSVSGVFWYRTACDSMTQVTRSSLEEKRP